MYPNLPMALCDNPGIPCRLTSMMLTANAIDPPTKDEAQLIFKQYPHATEVSFQSPILVVVSPEPPAVTALTVGGAPAVFVPMISDFVKTPGRPGNPKLRDPIPRKSIDPNFWKLLGQIYALFEPFTPRIIGTCFRNIIVELMDDVDISTLPGVIGGRVAYYCVGRNSLKDEPNGRSRLLQPSDDTKDTTNYLPHGLFPGVYVEGESIGTSVGCTLQKDNVRRLVVANHGFEAPQTNVYHPLYHSNIIGSIDERWEHIDIALCELHAEASFTNKEYFDAPTPKRLVMSDSVMDEEGWCFVDGATTGSIPLLRCGLAYIVSGVPPSTYHELHQYRAYNLKVFGPGVGEVGRGICGAPVVSAGTDDALEGEVLGFFSWSKGDLAYVHAVDDMVAAGWNVADM